MTKEQQTIYNLFQTLERNQQKELLSNVCSNMIENKAWEDIAELIITQLGYSDAMYTIVGYPKKNLK